MFGFIKEMMLITSVLAKELLVATSATHPERLIHPVIQLSTGLHDGQAIIATQWYCPPAVGYALRNSAREAASARLQIPAVINPQSTAEDPPLGSAKDREADNAVQEFKIAKASPSIDNGEKLRFSSCLTPNAASISASATLARLTEAVEPFRPVGSSAGRC